MSSIQAKVMNMAFRCMPPKGPEKQNVPKAERKQNYSKSIAASAEIRVSQVQLGSQSGEWIRKPGNNNGVIFYIHGGGFTVGSAREMRPLCRYLTSVYGYDCISVNYRLAPEHRWPAQLEDCFDAYVSILEKHVKPEKIVLMGESAGGTLALSLCLMLKDKGLAMPQAIVALSPSVSQADRYPSHSTNIKTDHMLKDAVLRGMKEPLFGGDPGPEVLHDPYVSPIYGDYSGLPPVFLSASDSEVLLDDSVELYKKLSNEGHRVQLDIQHGCSHTFQVFPGIPEARQAFNNAFSFLRTI